MYIRYIIYHSITFTVHQHNATNNNNNNTLPSFTKINFLATFSFIAGYPCKKVLAPKSNSTARLNVQFQFHALLRASK